MRQENEIRQSILKRWTMFDGINVSLKMSGSVHVEVNKIIEGSEYRGVIDVYVDEVITAKIDVIEVIGDRLFRDLYQHHAEYLLTKSKAN